MHLKNEGKNESSSTSQSFFYEGPKKQLAFKYFANDPIRSWRTLIAQSIVRNSMKQIFLTFILLVVAKLELVSVHTNYPFKLLSLLTVRLLQITLLMCDWLWGSLTRRIECDGPLLESVKFTCILRAKIHEHPSVMWRKEEEEEEQVLIDYSSWQLLDFTFSVL